MKLTCFAKRSTQLILTLFLFLMVATVLNYLGRSLQLTSQNASGQSKPSAIIVHTDSQQAKQKTDASTNGAKSIAPSVIPKDGVHDEEELLPCAIGQPRNKFGNCPPRPVCPKRCYLNLSPRNPKDCSNHPGFELQKVDGVFCAYTFPPAR